MDLRLRRRLIFPARDFAVPAPKNPTLATNCAGKDEAAIKRAAPTPPLRVTGHCPDMTQTAANRFGTVRR